MYFTIPRIILDIWNKPNIQRIKDTMNYQLKRDNNYEKIEDFFDKSQDFIFEMKHNWELQYGASKTQSRSQEIEATSDNQHSTSFFSNLRIQSLIATRSKL